MTNKRINKKMMTNSKIKKKGNGKYEKKMSKEKKIIVNEKKTLR